MKRTLTWLCVLLLAFALVLPALAEEAVATEAAEATAETAVEETVEEAEEASPAPSGAYAVFEDLLTLPWYTWVILVVMVFTSIFLIIGSKKTAWNSRRVSMGAMCIAIAFVLSCIRLFRMPQGGSITPANILPLVMFMVACGPTQGFVVGCAYGLLQLITDPYVIHPIQMLVDYPLASGALILGCLATVLPIPKRWQLPVAVLLGGIGNYCMAVLSGVVFFAEYAGEQNALIYSLTYNISYLGPNVLFAVLIACVPGMDRLVDIIRKR